MLSILVPLLAATCCQALTALNPSPKPYSECDKASDEFFYLVHQWPPGYCQVEHCSRSPPEKFTIHGFWPNYCQDRRGKDWPEFCSGEDFDTDTIADLVTTMEDEWPSLAGNSDAGFWKHEWDKHGTCALSYTPFGLHSEHEYFETVLDLHEANNLHDVLDQRGIAPGGSYSVSEIQAAIVDAFGGDAFLHCQGRNVLVEIYICYNQRLERVSCSRGGVCNEDLPVQFLLEGQALNVA